MDPRAATGPRRVLVAEDSADIRGLWRTWLTFSGFLVEEASNGVEAIMLARAKSPDLILMDLCMPVMDGVEAIKLLRAEPSTAEIPIIVITAQGTEDSARLASDAGADAYLDKPVMPDELLQHMTDAFDRKRLSVTEMARRAPRPRSRVTF